MTVSVRVGRNVNLDGKTYSQSKQLTAEGSINRRPSRAAAKIGALTTRTSDTAGELTMNAGHGITTGVKLDIYWSVGGVNGVRRNVTVGAVAVNQVPFTLGTGDILPADESPITAMIPVAMELRFDGDDLVAIAVASTVPAVVVLTGDDDVEDHAIVLPYDNMEYDWDKENGTVNPIAGDVITKAYITHGSSAGTKEIPIGIATN